MLNIYHNAIRDFVSYMLSKGKDDQLIRHSVGTDEVHDPSLIAYRLYQNRQDYDVVMVCAGTNAIWQPLELTDIFLPTFPQLVALKRRFQAFYVDGIF